MHSHQIWSQSRSTEFGPPGIQSGENGRGPPELRTGVGRPGSKPCCVTPSRPSVRKAAIGCQHVRKACQHVRLARRRAGRPWPKTRALVQLYTVGLKKSIFPCFSEDPSKAVGMRTCSDEANAGVRTVSFCHELWPQAGQRRHLGRSEAAINNAHALRRAPSGEGCARRGRVARARAELTGLGPGGGRRRRRVLCARGDRRDPARSAAGATDPEHVTNRAPKSRVGPNAAAC